MTEVGSGGVWICSGGGGDVDVGEVDDGEGAEGERVFGVGDGCDEVCWGMLVVGGRRGREDGKDEDEDEDGVSR